MVRTGEGTSRPPSSGSSRSPRTPTIAGTAERAAKACSIRASVDQAELEAALALARKGVELGKGGQWSEWRLLALGMAEYRSGNYAAAIEALLAAAKAEPKNAIVAGLSGFYRGDEPVPAG